MDFSAKWIWKEQNNYKIYNQTVVFIKDFEISKECTVAMLGITADTFYRLKVNDIWVNDGPSRGYPEHYNYDLIDIAPYLRQGENKISVTAKFFGCETFHQICQQAGFIAQLELKFADGSSDIIKTDSSWQVAEAFQWKQEAPRIMCQMEAVEMYDAELEDNLVFEPAAELFDIEQAPWQGLMERDCPLLTKKEFSLNKFIRAEVVKSSVCSIDIPTRRMCYPGIFNSSSNTSTASGIALIVDNVSRDDLEISSETYSFTVNGVKAENGKAQLARGKNFILAFNRQCFSHIPEQKLIFSHSDGYNIINPIDENIAYPCFLRFPELLHEGTDLDVINKLEVKALAEKITAFYDDFESRVDSLEVFTELLGKYAEVIADEDILPGDFYAKYISQKVCGCKNAMIKNPEKLIFSDSSCTVISPSEDGDVQLIYDLGMQNIGYYDFELVADAGVVLDIFAVEHIYENGEIQDTGVYQNGMRYVCKAGRNKFTSLKRRSGRYIIIVICNQKTEIKFMNFKLIESTYPVEYKGAFRCSDEFMNRLWQISAHTLKLCMEDSFTDCPLYEQTLWVGDARNEALFAYPVFGAWDLSRRCSRITAESLETLPMAGSQVPSCWDTIIPIWSFLWGISVWDYYFETGEEDLLREVWPAIVENLAEAERRLDDKTGLFSSSTWNMFDWSGSKTGYNIVIHNTMFMIGALQAAVKCAEVLRENALVDKWSKLIDTLKVTVNNYYDEERGCWPDSLDDDKKPIDSYSIHGNFLSILYDIVDADKIEKVEKVLFDPPEYMVKVGSPFAMQYMYETLDKLGMQNDILKRFYSSYNPMLEHDATTVWETYAGSLGGLELTRSHCHGWSSSPNYFLNRIVLGIKMTKTGAEEFAISPYVEGLEWAKGESASVLGGVKVSWKKDGNKLVINAKAPENVKLKYEPNPSHDGLEIVFNN